MNTNYLFSLLLGLILLTWVSNCEHLCGHNDLELNIQLSDENVNEDGYFKKTLIIIILLEFFFYLINFNYLEKEDN